MSTPSVSWPRASLVACPLARLGPPMSGGWGGRRAQAWTRAVLANATERDDLGRPLCILRLRVCTRLATTGDHIIPRALRPDLQYEVANGQPACGPCNSSKGRTLSLLRPVVVVNGSEFFDTPPTGKPRDPFPFSPGTQTKPSDITKTTSELDKLEEGGP